MNSASFPALSGSDRETPPTTTTPQAEDRAATAPPPGEYGWADDFLAHAPFPVINAALIRCACEMPTLVSRSTRAATALLKALCREHHGEPEEEADIAARIEMGDPSVVADYPDLFDHQDIAAPFAQIYGYARSGDGPELTPERSRPAIERLLERHRRLLALIPEVIRREMGDGFNWLADTLAAAEGRWATDNGTSVAPEHLAALAGVRIKTVTNLIAAKALATDDQGRVPAAVALAWLTTRKDFVPSSWQTERYDLPAVAGRAATAVLDPQIFVPVDGEGLPFLPSLARRSKGGVLRFTIGEKAAPEFVEDYWEALARLARTPTPRWRRPNPGGQGGWGLVSAQEGWRRYARADLERMIAATRREEG